MIKIAMIEDDLELAEVLSLYLKQFNIEVVNFEEPAAREIIEEPAAVAEPQEVPKTFGEKIKWLFKKG